MSFTDVDCSTLPPLEKRLLDVFLGDDQKDACHEAVSWVLDLVQHLDPLPDTPGAWYEVIALIELAMEATARLPFQNWDSAEAIEAITRRCRLVAAQWPEGIYSPTVQEGSSRQRVCLARLSPVPTPAVPDAPRSSPAAGPPGRSTAHTPKESRVQRIRRVLVLQWTRFRLRWRKVLGLKPRPSCSDQGTLRDDRHYSGSEGAGAVPARLHGPQRLEE